MTIIGILVLVILVVLAVWVVTQIGLQEPFRSICMVVILLIVILGMLYVLGFLPGGRIMLR